MNSELLQALNLAKQAEIEGLKSYLKYAKQTESASAKNMFVQLALDETDHMELIQKFIDKTINGEVYEAAEVPKGRLSKFMPNTANLKKENASTVTDEEALKIAMEHEKQAREFYLAEAEKSDVAEVKDFFSKLADVELLHYNILKAELDFMSQAGFWFDAMEFSVEME